SVAEAADEIGGRLRFETRLPGLAAWGRVLDWRRTQLERLPNVSIYRGNRLSAEEILELGNTHVVIATGARWARLLYSALEIPAGRLEGPGIFTPDDVAEGARIEGPVAVYDFDNYYMGSVLAEHLARSGQRVAYVTPAGHASAWAIMSNEQPQIHRALFSAGVALHTLSRVTAFAPGELTLTGQCTDTTTRIPCRSLVIVGARFASDALHQSLAAQPEELTAAGIRSVSRIGDALAPGAIVHAVYSGHRYARELDADPATLGFRRDARSRGTRRPLPPHATRAGIWRDSRERLRAPAARCRHGSDAPLDLVSLRERAGGGEGADLLPGVGLCRPRGGARRARSIPRSRCPRREHHPLAQSRGGAARLLQRLSPSRRATVPRGGCARFGRGGGIARGAAAPRRHLGRPHHLPLSPVDLRLERPPDRRALADERAGVRQEPVQPVSGGCRVLGRLRVREPEPREGRIARRAARRDAQTTRALPPERASDRSHDPLPGGRELEGALRELQRVLSLRGRAPGALRASAGVPRARRRQSRLAARHPASGRRLHLHEIRQVAPAPLPDAERG